MKKELVTEPEIKLIGLAVRTNNEQEMDPQKAKIRGLVEKYRRENIAAHLRERKHPGTTIVAYTDYDSDEFGDYTFYIGEEVLSIENAHVGLQTLTIPKARYQKFTTNPGKMPAIIINAWKKIWQMTAAELGGKRAYGVDFEVHDERSKHPENAVVDIYINIK